jgi:quinol-cytochrome oxidoreductase complex cytochrome b subunit
MLLSAAIHMLRNFYLKIYEKPRELLWILGVITGFIALQTAFFGYSLIGDTTAFEAVQIGKGLVANSLGEWLGKTLGALAFGTEGIDFRRVLAFHVLMAGLLGLLFAAHFGLFESIGPFIGRRKKQVSESDLAPWFPVNFIYMTALLMGVWGLIVLANALSQAAGFVHRLIYPLPIFEGTPLAERVRPMPPWFLVYAFKLFQLDFLYIGKQGFNALPIFILSLIVPPLILISIPFIDRKATADPLERYAATSITLYLVTILATLTVWGAATLGYSSKAVALSIFLAPAIVIFSGLRVLAKRKKGEMDPYYAVFYISTTIVIAAFLPLVAGVMADAPGSQVAAEVGTALFGVAMAALLVYLASWYSEKIAKEASETAAEGEAKANPAGGDVPQLFIIIGVASTLIIGLTAALLGYAGVSVLEVLKPTTIQPPPQIDPVKNPAGIAALTATLLFGLYSLFYVLYRVYVLEKVPFKGNVREFLPHLPTIVSLIVAIALVF